jgi:hypothetical protein
MINICATMLVLMLIPFKLNCLFKFILYIILMLVKINIIYKKIKRINKKLHKKFTSYNFILLYSSVR